MEITERERNISAVILIVVLTISILYQFPGLIGASNAFIGSGASESDISRGELVFMQDTGPEQVQIGDLASFRYEIGSGEHVVLVRTVIDQRYEDGDRELNVRDVEGQGTEWMPEDSIMRRDRFSAPFLGYVIEYTNNFVGLIVLIALPLSVLIYYEVERITEELDSDFFD